MFNIKKNTKIYALCEPSYATGGTEAIHQLVNKLRGLGHDAYVFYHTKVPNPKPESYNKYNTEHVFSVSDNPEDILIIPEGSVGTVSKYRKIQRAIWWLSVDNVQTNTSVLGSKLNNRFSSLKKNKFVLAAYRILSKRGKMLFNFKNPANKNIIHLAQSSYAENYLTNKDANNIYPLTDYLGSSHFKKMDLKKENIVLYNPRKGFEITKKLIALSNSGRDRVDIQWVPLQNMTPAQVAETMAKSKVYIDFGHHPGKDRMPREAAMKNCCVIVGRRGSAKFNQDVTIPIDYKFSVKPVNKRGILKKIKNCISHFERNSERFELYRRIIRTNERQFELEVEQIFGKKK
jgi:hypothetical protein